MDIFCLIFHYERQFNSTRWTTSLFYAQCLLLLIFHMQVIHRKSVHFYHSLLCLCAQVNFVACQLFALLMAVWFRIYLHPSKTSPFIRHVVATLLGFYLALFCFGWWVTPLFIPQLCSCHQCAFRLCSNLPSYSITLVTLFSCKQRACPSFMLWLCALF